MPRGVKGPAKPEEPGRDRGSRAGQPKYTPEQLEQLCGDYFARCDELERRYTDAGLILHLGVAEDTFRAWRANDGGKYGEVSEVLKRAMLRMQDDMQQRGDTMSIFRLKQPRYGGFADRPAEDGNHTIKVVVSFGNTDAKTAIEYGK